LNKILGRKILIGSSVIALVISTQTVASAAPVAQWASGASATTEYSEPYSAKEIIGAPNAYDCDDEDMVWASLADDSIDLVTATYATSVIPTEIKIHQNNIQGAISKVEVSLNGTSWKSVYTADPALASSGTCESTASYNDILTVTVSSITIPINQVRLTVDQSIIQKWAEIDAVQLVGKQGQKVSSIAKSLKVSKSLKLPVKTNKNFAVTWKTSTKAICVIKSGKLQALKKGTCKIAGTSAGNASFGGLSVSLSIAVKK